MENKSKSIKKLILGNIFTLFLAVIMLGTLSYAWFAVTIESDKDQSIQIGRFIINLQDTIEDFPQTKSVNITNAYPMTRSAAIESSKEATPNNLYRFAIKNEGTVSAMFKLKVTNIVDSNKDAIDPIKPLYEQTRYAMRIYRDNSSEDTMGEYGIDGLMATPAIDTTPNNVAINDYFVNELLTLTVVETANQYKGQTKYFLKPNETIYIDLVVWLDEKATIESTGANVNDDGGNPVNPTLNFKLQMQAMQSDGGAYWTQTEIDA